MKSKLLLICTILFGATILSASNNPWVIKNNFINERSTHVAFSINGIGYVCAGADKNGINLKDLWAYDNSKDTWIRKADYPGGNRQELSCFVIDGYAYVGSGRDAQTGVCYNSYYKYDPTNNSWSSIADCPVARYAGVGFSIDSIGYFTCGLSPSEPRMDDLYAYNPRTNKWIKKASVNSGGGRAFPIALSYNGKGYLYGGYTGSTILNGVWEYNPVNDQWSYKSASPSGNRSFAFGFEIEGKLFFGMGRTYGNDNKKDWFYFDLSNNTWKRIINLHPSSNTVGGATFVIGKKGYTIGGFDVPGNLYSNVNELVFDSLNSTNTNIRAITSRNSNVIKGYCNQTERTLYLEIQEGDYELSILSLSGQEIKNYTGNATDNNLIDFDISDLASQQYVAVLRKGIEIYTFKFILQ